MENKMICAKMAKEITKKTQQQIKEEHLAFSENFINKDIYNAIIEAANRGADNCAIDIPFYINNYYINDNEVKKFGAKIVAKLQTEYGYVVYLYLTGGSRWINIYWR